MTFRPQSTRAGSSDAGVSGAGASRDLPRALRGAAAVLWGLGTVVVLAVPVPALPSGLPLHFSGLDKVVHALLFGGQAALLMWARTDRIGSLAPRASAVSAVLGRAAGLGLQVWLVASIFGAATEVLQALLPTRRTADLLDWGADSAGAALAVAVWLWSARGRGADPLEGAGGSS